MFRRSSKQEITAVPVAAGAESYRPGLFYFTSARSSVEKGWPGPKYFGNARWRADLLEVIGQIRAVVQTNANLPAGLQAAAREHRRQIHDWTQRRIGLFFRAAFIPLGLLFLFLIMIAAGGFRGAESVGYLALITGILCTGYGVVAFYRAGTVEAVLLKLRDDLEEGRQLSEAMRRMHRFFPPIAADLVAMGESTGQLTKGLAQLNEDVLDGARHRAGMGKQGIYFFLVATIQAFIIVFIAVKVLPVFVEIQEEFGSEVPPATEAVLSVVDFFYYNLFGFQTQVDGVWTHSSSRQLRALLVLLSAAWAGWWLVRGGARRIAFAPRGQFWLYIPVAAGFVRARNLGAIGQLMAALLRAGMPLPDALGRVAACHLSGAYRRALLRIKGRVEEGTELSAAFGPETRVFPLGFQAFVRLGERSGLLPEAFAQCGDQYRRRHQVIQQYLRSTVLPIGILLLGGINLLIALAAFEVLVGLSDAIMANY